MMAQDNQHIMVSRTHCPNCKKTTDVTIIIRIAGGVVVAGWQCDTCGQTGELNIKKELSQQQ